MASAPNAVDFIADNRSMIQTPDSVWEASKRSLLDLLAVAAAGRGIRASQIACEIACQHWPPGGSKATLLFDGRSASAAGAAFAGAQTIDSFDAHDGFKPSKGHAGVAVLPSLLAVMEAEDITLTARQFLESLVIGYEIACRVAIAQHATCTDYHASGSWNALGAAAVTTRVLKLKPSVIREALGIAEYFGPRAQMMRVIDSPTMLKDSSSWGAMVGTMAGYLAASGFTGAPAITVEGENVGDVWQDLGQRWRITEQYFKPWPVCRWAQPAVQAAIDLKSRYQINIDSVQKITIRTFHEACRLFNRNPTNTEQAQYDIAFPTACAFVRGRIGMEEVSDMGLNDPTIRAVAAKIGVEQCDDYSKAFPSKRYAQLTVLMDDAKTYESDRTEAPGDPELPLSNEALLEKCTEYFESSLGPERADLIIRAVGDFKDPDFDLHTLLKVIREPMAA